MDKKAEWADTWVLRRTTDEEDDAPAVSLSRGEAEWVLRLDGSVSEMVEALQEEVAAELHSQRAAGARLRLQTLDPAVRAVIALERIAPGGWDEVEPPWRVTVVDERTPAPSRDNEDAQALEAASAEEAPLPPPPASPIDTAPVEPSATSVPEAAHAPLAPAADAAEAKGTHLADEAAAAPAQPPAPVPATARGDADRTFDDALFELRRQSAWNGRDSAEAQRALEAALRHPHAPSHAQQRAEKAMAAGQTQHDAQAHVERVARKHGAHSPQARRAVEEALQRVTWRGFPGRLQKALERISAQQARAQAARQGPLTTVTAGSLDHRIPALAPTADWELVIDEGGTFRADAQGRVEGRFVGLLVPRGTALPPLAAGWHAVDEGDLRQIDRVVQAVLDAPVGVLGFEVDSVTSTRGDAWETGVLELIHWTCRLLPIQGPTRLSVLVEHRGDQEKETSWRAATNEVLRQLNEQDPERYGGLSLTLRLIDKYGSPLNGYVDALAFTWTSPTPPSRARLAASGLREGCLHQGSAARLRRAWDAMRAGRLSGEQALELVHSPDAQQPRSIAHTLLEQLGQACREDSARWRSLLEAVRGHLEGKAVHLGRLGREVAFLAAWCPPGAHLTPRLRLAWLTAQLERANHLGAVDGELDRELDALGGQLMEEVPTLVCQADLDRAVLATNRFDFQGAARALKRWEDMPPVAAGLQHWARVRSSRGQHAAFLDMPDVAEALFLEALDAFARLSERDVAHGERLQTGTYLALTTLDTPHAPVERVREHVSAIVSLEPERVTALARSSAPATKYAHHLLLRYLTTRGTDEERAAYLAAEDGWEAGEGHPWPLIEWYRALLLHRASDAPGARERVQRAVELASAAEQGPTVAFIGLVLGLGGQLLGLEPSWRLPDAASLRRALPRAPWAHVEAALSGTWTSGAEAFVTRCLPFNFR